MLARAGVASRRAAERLIAEGRVAVNGAVVREAGTQIDAAVDRVEVDGRPVALAAPVPRMFVVYKPVWMVTTWSDPQGRPTVRELVQELELRLFPVGRLDFDAEGLLLLTNDGPLAHRLMHPRYQVRRTYLVRVRGQPGPQTLARLRAGLELEDGPARPLEVVALSHPTAEAEGDRWLRVALAEGRNHLVKRLLAAVGHPVMRLVRAEYGGVTLGRLRPGERRELPPDELSALHAATETPAIGPYPGSLDIPPSPLRAPAASRGSLTPRHSRG
ncbi:MAG: pseudouridine synthase [Deltaproteobacteria bacterium]